MEFVRPKSNHAENIIFNFNSMNMIFYKERVIIHLFPKPNIPNAVLTQENQCRHAMVR